MRFVCDSCHAQYMINDGKVGAKGVKVRCRKCGHVILVKKDTPSRDYGATPSDDRTQAIAIPAQLDAAATLGDEATNPGSQRDVPDSVDSLRADLNDDTGRYASSDSFLGAGADEIGAAFDEALRTTPISVPKEAARQSHVVEDRLDTRVIDSDEVERLAALSQASRSADEAPSDKPKKSVSDVPANDWYVAVDEKQIGPVHLEKLKEYWNSGEIGGESLCWREGFDDWVAIAETPALLSILSPKPIVVGPAAMAPMASAPGNVPGRSSASMGSSPSSAISNEGIGAFPSLAMTEPESSGAWRPSAAAALSSLVKQELDVLHRPPGARISSDSGLAARGVSDAVAPLLSSISSADLPSPEIRAAQPVAHMVPAMAAPNPYLHSSNPGYAAAPMVAFQAPGNRNLSMMLGIGGGILVLGLVALVIFFATRQTVVVAPPAASAPTPTQPAEVPKQVAPKVVPVEPAPPPPQPTSTQVEPAPAGTTPENVVAQPTAPLPTKIPPSNIKLAKTERAERTEKPEKAEHPPEAKPEPSSSSDEFGEVFGSSVKEAPKEKPKADPKKQTVYIPPAPGAAGDVKESLGRSDIMEVVLANKSSLLKCADEQRKKEPGLSGVLVMKWTIQTSGKTSGVSVVSDEFKNTYFAGCMGGVIRNWTFPRHKQAGDPVEFPFKF